jgi:hypothetical protein
MPLIHNDSAGCILVYHLMSFSFHDAMLVLLTWIIFCGPWHAVATNPMELVPFLRRIEIPTY